MRFLSHSDEARRPAATTDYESTVTVASQILAGVEFTILRLSFMRRMELARKVLELGRRLEFRGAGEGIEDKLEANIIACEIDRLYLTWGLVRVTGLSIDGADATAESLVERGPEDLAREIVNAIKGQCGLNDNERKN